MGELNKNKAVNGADALRLIFDAGTFTEVSAYMRRGGTPDEYEGVVCGYGSVGERLVFAFAQDSGKMGGAFDALAAKKIENLYTLALKSGAPVVGVFGCSGSVTADGSSLLDGIGKLYACISDSFGEIPQIALVCGSCTGSMAVAASMFDIAVTVKGADFSAGAHFVTGLDDISSETGLSAVACADTASGAAAVRSLIRALPDNAGSVAVSPAGDMQRPVGAQLADGHDMVALIAALSDSGEYTGLYTGYGDGMTAALAPLAGRYCGIVGCAGDITAAGAKKAAGFVRFCGEFGIPLVTLMNTNGFEASADAEKQGIAAALASLARAYAEADCARICVVCARACGAAFPIMGAKSSASDMVFALPGAVISPLTPERAVAFLWNDRITAQTSREMLEKQWAAENASPESAAQAGDIDCVVSPAELRARICSALLMLDDRR